MFAVYDSSKRSQIVMLCWAIWRVRNDVVWNKKRARVSNVLFLARKILDSWTKAQSSDSILTKDFLTASDGASSWIKPKHGGLKLNVDAALFSDSDGFGVACSLLVVQALRSGVCTTFYFGSVIAECISVWNTLPTVSILFVYRSANLAAHSLARHSSSYVDRLFCAREIDPSTFDADSFH